MKLKYYLRGLGVGIICTAIIMGIALSGNKKQKLTDAEIIERARLLGMVMEDESSESDENNNEKKEAENNKIGEQQSENTILDQQNLQDEKSQKENIQNNAVDNKTSDESDESDNQTDKSDESDNQTDKSDESDKSDGLENSGNQTTNKDSQDTVELEIKEGDFSDVVSRKLFQAGLIPDASEFNNYVTKKGVDDSLRIGVYHIPIGSTADEIIEILQGKRK